MRPLSDLDDDAFDRLLHRAVALPDAPPALLRSAIDLYASAAMRQPSALQALAQAARRQLQAVLSFDSWAATPLATGLRAGSTATRHLLFSAQGRDIDLRITPGPGHFVLSGQVLGPDESGSVELAALPAADGVPDATAATTTLDALGEFRLDGVAAGRYRVRLRVGDDEIDLPVIDIGGDRP